MNLFDAMGLANLLCCKHNLEYPNLLLYNTGVVAFSWETWTGRYVCDFDGVMLKFFKDKKFQSSHMGVARTSCIKYSYLNH